MTIDLSRHFIEQWECYFGEPPPSVKEIIDLVRESVWLTRCKTLYEEDGTPYRQLGMYWNTKRNVIIKIDWIRGRAVTVITPLTNTRKNIDKDLRNGA